MSIASKLLGIWAVNKTVSSATPLFMRLLVGMATIVLCAIIAAVIIVMLIAGGVWLIYQQLTAYGIDTQTSGLIVGSLLLALLASIMLSAKKYYCQFRSASYKMFSFQPATGGRISRAVDAFMDGFDSGQTLR